MYRRAHPCCKQAYCMVVDSRNTVWFQLPLCGTGSDLLRDSVSCETLLFSSTSPGHRCTLGLLLTSLKNHRWANPWLASFACSDSVSSCSLSSSFGMNRTTFRPDVRRTLTPRAGLLCGSVCLRLCSGTDVSWKICPTGSKLARKLGRMRYRRSSSGPPLRPPVDTPRLSFHRLLEGLSAAGSACELDVRSAARPPICLPIRPCHRRFYFPASTRLLQPVLASAELRP